MLTIKEILALNLSFRKIISLILCFAFLLGATASFFVYANHDSSSMLAEDGDYTKSDNSKENNDKELEDKKLSGLTDRFILTIALLSKKYELESIGSPNFLSFPPFSPPNN
ncbi:MAG: hypothetical protein K0R25_229 [Rickettsiaceae bacterium]|nr:hypothetical protein [Rickettsiaceae bacterium]